MTRVSQEKANGPMIGPIGGHDWDNTWLSICATDVLRFIYIDGPTLSFSDINCPNYYIKYGTLSYLRLGHIVLDLKPLQLPFH